MKSRPKSKSRTTIVDIADAAGVAVGTASNALNGKGRVSEATRDRVLKVAEGLNWTPHRAAHGLPTGRTMSIGVRFAHDATVPAGAFFIELLAAAAEAANDVGYGLLINSRAFDPTPLVDALIVVDPRTDTIVRPAGAWQLPVVTVGRLSSQDSAIPWVDVDHRDAVQRLLDHLAQDAGDLNDAEAWMLSLPDRQPFVRDLESGFRAWCKQRKVKPKVLPSPDQPLAAANVVGRQLKRGVTPAVLVSVLERQAMGAHQALRDLRVPIGSASDGDLLAMLEPPVPALDLSGREHGRAAVSMAVQWIETGSAPPPRLLPARLVKRF
jgi:DNA-binding LacI/PurR family transcriptional regulator